jgi:CubicO group peptidase (beta-lactamase class C family)
MSTNLNRLIRWGAVLSLLAVLGYGGFTLSRLAPIGTAYAAKTLCSGVFVSGRPADAVIAEDIMAGVHPLLKLVHVSVDVERQRARASFVGFAVREAAFRRGLGCTLALEAPSGALAPTPRIGLDSSEPDATPVLTAMPPPAEVDARKLQAAVDGAFAEPNPAEPRRTRAVVVVYRGRVIAERFAPGISARTPLPGWSMTKSVTGALVGVLVKEGKLALDKSALLPAWRDAGDPRARITLDQLLRMTSGLQFNEDYDDPLSDVAVMLFAQPDGSEFAALKPLESPPGARWQYSSGTAAILAPVMREALGGTEQDYLQFPRRALFTPLGMRSAIFEPDASGMLVTASFMYASAHDWARFGQLLLQDGMWDGRRILPEGWVRYMTTATPQSPRRDFGAHLWVKVPEPPTAMLRRHRYCPPTRSTPADTKASLSA